MSRLSMTEQSRDSSENIHLIVQTDDLPTTVTQIVTESVHDSLANYPLLWKLSNMVAS